MGQPINYPTVTRHQLNRMRGDRDYPIEAVLHFATGPATVRGYAQHLDSALNQWIGDLETGDTVQWSHLLDARDGTQLATFRDGELTFLFGH